MAERLILDSDLGGDCDDAAAFGVLHALADRGEVEIFATVIVNTHPDAVPCAHAINTWYGRPDLPIGTIKRDTGFSMSESLLSIVRDYPHRVTRQTAEDAVKLYRRLLANSPDQSVSIVSIGPPTNISDLLDSEPDEHSPLGGVELMRKKVKLYAAGGNGGGNLPHGRAGWNYQQDWSAAQNELAKLPTNFPTVFAGGSGWRAPTGNCFFNAAKDHIVRRAYEDFFQGKPDMQRPSPDQLRVLYAGRPSARGQWELSAPGDITLPAERTIHWEPLPNRNRFCGYVRDLKTMQGELEKLMLHQPKRRG